MANILVTGGAGYVGSNVLIPLINHGHTPIVFDNYVRGHRLIGDIDKRIEMVEGDLGEPRQISEAMTKYNIDAIMHYAALAYVGESNKIPDKYHLFNIAYTLNLLNASIGYRQKSGLPIVFSSSCAVFGDPDSLPITEQTTKDPISPYGRSKLAAEWIIRDLGEAYGFSSVILRYFNASGADLKNKTGERHEPETHLIPLAIRAARSGKQLEINGNDYETKDGTAIRDFIHVKDLASAHIIALNYLLAGGKSADFNLGSEEGHSVLEVVHTIERVTGTKINIRWSARRDGDPRALVCDTTKAQKELGWRAKHSNLENIVKDAADWDATINCIEDFSSDK